MKKAFQGRKACCMLGVLIQLPQHLLPQWLLCVKSLAIAPHCFFLEQASEGIFGAAELTRVTGWGGGEGEEGQAGLGVAGKGCDSASTFLLPPPQPVPEPCAMLHLQSKGRVKVRGGSVFVEKGGNKGRKSHCSEGTCAAESCWCLHPFPAALGMLPATLGDALSQDISNPLSTARPIRISPDPHSNPAFPNWPLLNIWTGSVARF